MSDLPQGVPQPASVGEPASLEPAPAEKASPPRPRRWRRWLQFRLRTLLLLTAAAAIAAWVWSWPEKLTETDPSGAHKIVREIVRDADGAPVSHGRWTLLDAQGRRLIEGTYRRGVPHGSWTYWHVSGRKVLAGACRDGQRVGVWSAWYPSGQKQSEIAYADGLPHGPARRWWDNGELAETGRHEQGRRVEAWTVLDRDGNRGGRAEAVAAAESAAITHWRTALTGADLARADEAGWALARLGTPAEAAIDDALRSQRPEVFCRGLLAVSSGAGTERWLPRIERGLSDERLHVRLTAFRAASHMGRAASKLLPKLDARPAAANKVERSYLLAAIVAAAPDRLAASEQFLREQVPCYRPVDLAQSFHDSGPAHAIQNWAGNPAEFSEDARSGRPHALHVGLLPGILRQRDNADPQVRARAALALGWLTPPGPESVPTLILALDDTDIDVRIDACLALAMLGKFAEPAISKLEPLARAADPCLAATAQTVISIIQSARAPRTLPQYSFPGVISIVPVVGREDRSGVRDQARQGHMTK